ncbi:MAG TPA: hypothetical protein VFB71_05825 [Ramlibacter sp.]|nr:hypothetical protein [Ramlibacter sp.]
MSSTRSDDGPDARESGTWTTETLPLAVRRELLERELKRLGFRKADGQGQGRASQGGPPQQRRPQADPDGGSHGD